MIVWVKYGFESMPLKMYNMNVSSAILLSFLKATCIKDIDEHCKQRSIQLSIELDATRRSMAHRKSVSHAPSVAAVATPPGSRPPSGSASCSAAEPLDSSHQSRSSTPNSVRRGLSPASDSLEDLSEEVAAAKAKKEQLEKQLDTINVAAKFVKALIAGIAWVDLVDQNGTRMNLDSAGNARVNTLLAARQQYTAVAVTKNEFGDAKVSPLAFKLK